MLCSSLKPFEEGSICFCLAFVYVQASEFAGCSGFGFFFFDYVKEVWPEAPSDEQHGTRAECFRKRGGIGWQPVQCSCSQSH